MQNRHKQILSTALTTTLVLLFTYTASAKWYDHILFESILAQSPLLRPWAPALSWAVPAVEMVIVALLIFPSTRKRGLLAAAILLFSFCLYIIAMLTISPHLPCSCGGVVSALSWQAHLALNAILATLSVWTVRVAEPPTRPNALFE